MTVMVKCAACGNPREVKDAKRAGAFCRSCRPTKEHLGIRVIPGGLQTVRSDETPMCTHYRDVIHKAELRLALRSWRSFAPSARKDADQICVGYPVAASCLSGAIGEGYTGIAGGLVLVAGVIEG